MILHRENIKISCNFQGNIEYSSSVSNYEISINDVAHETSSTSSDAGWPFDAPDGWYWIRTLPSEIWLIKDDGSIERLYYRDELLLENTKINGKSVKTYENPNILNLFGFFLIFLSMIIYIFNNKNYIIIFYGDLW